MERVERWARHSIRFRTDRGESFAGEERRVSYEY